MKIGILGGSFNPIHNMHIDIAKTLINDGLLDKVIFVPTGDKYQKNNLISQKHRYRMLELVCNQYPSMEVSDYEMKNSLVRTHQTLDYFKNENPNDTIYFVMGTDNLSEIDTWKNYKMLLETHQFLVIRRKGDNVDEILNKYNKYRNNILITNVQMNNVSSTQIREMINKGNDEVKNYLYPEVNKYIKVNNLYI